MRTNRRVRSTAIVWIAVAMVALLPSAAAAASRDRSAVSAAMTAKTAEVSPVVRVNQVGYPTGGTKVAYAMLPAKAARVSFEVVTPYGVAYRGTSTDDLGLVTAFPHDYYPGSQWTSDMLWGAAEIALADEATGAPAARVRADLATAARWARAYIAQGHADTFNLLAFALGGSGVG